MAMHNPPHPGEFIIRGLSGAERPERPRARSEARCAASTLNRILTGTSGISPEMALRLSKALAALRRVGLPCSTTTISGRPSSTSN